MDWEDMYENRQNDGGRSEGEDPANRSEIRGPVTSQSDRGDGELQDEEKDDKVEDPNCYDFKRLRQLSTVVGSKVQVLMSLEECKSQTCIVLLGMRVRVQEEEMSIKD